MILELLQKHTDVLFFCRKRSFLDLIDRCEEERIELCAQFETHSTVTLRQLEHKYIKENFFYDFDGMIDECLILLELIPAKGYFIKTRFTTYTLEEWDKFHMVDYIEFLRDKKIDDLLK